MASAISSEEMQTLWRIAEAMNASGDYKGKRNKDGSWSGVTTNEQAFNRILIGRDLGLSPAQAMMGIDLVRGNLQVRAVLLASFVRQSRDYDYKVIQHDERGCTLEFYRYPFPTTEAAQTYGSAEVLGTSTFTVEDAAHANLIRQGSPWETVPRNMVFARAMSNGVKWYCPDLLGGVPVYTEGDDLSREPEAIGAGESDEAPGWQGVSIAQAAEVEKVVRRAEKLGHVGLANLAAAQMALNGQSREMVAAWLTSASRALDQIAAAEPHLPDGREEEPETGAQGYVVPEESEQQEFSDPGGLDVPAKVKSEKADDGAE